MLTAYRVLPKPGTCLPFSQEITWPLTVLFFSLTVLKRITGMFQKHPGTVERESEGRGLEKEEVKPRGSSRDYPLSAMLHAFIDVPVTLAHPPRDTATLLLPGDHMAPQGSPGNEKQSEHTPQLRSPLWLSFQHVG